MEKQKGNEFMMFGERFYFRYKIFRVLKIRVDRHLKDIFCDKEEH